MTKHELMDFMYKVGPVTKHEIAEEFGVKYITAHFAIERLRKQGLARPVFVDINSGRTKFELTRYGEERLNYFDANTCYNRDCSCKNNN